MPRAARHRPVRRTIRLRRCSTPNRGCRRAARRLRRDRWTAGLSGELFQAIPSRVLAGVVGEPPCVGVRRSFPPFCLDLLFLLLFSTSSFVGSLAWIRSARARVVLWTLCSAVSKMNSIGSAAFLLSSASDAWLRTTRGRTDGFPQTDCIYLYVSKTILLAFSTNSRAINKSIYSESLSRFRRALVIVSTAVARFGVLQRDRSDLERDVRVHSFSKVAEQRWHVFYNFSENWKYYNYSFDFWIWLIEDTVHITKRNIYKYLKRSLFLSKSWRALNFEAGVCVRASTGDLW